MLALPCAWAYQHNCDRRVTNEAIPYVLTDCLCGKIVVVYVAFFNRLVHDIVPHLLDEPVLVCLILVVIADEYAVPWWLIHGYSPSTCSRSVRSSTPAISASIRL